MHAAVVHADNRLGCPPARPSSRLWCSGAVGVGCQRLRLCTRPDNLAQKQALAAVGQVHLMRYYDDLFTALDLVRLLVAPLIVHGKKTGRVKG